MWGTRGASVGRGRGTEGATGIPVVKTCQKGAIAPSLPNKNLLCIRHYSKSTIPISAPPPLDHGSSRSLPADIRSTVGAHAPPCLDSRTPGSLLGP